MEHSEQVQAILGQAKELAREYRKLTGKPLGITGEIAEHEAARVLELVLMPPRQAGYDAIRPSDKRKFQIKGRCVLPESKPGQRVGRIDLSKEFDAVLLVLMDQNFDATQIFEADRAAIIELATRLQSKRANSGALGVPAFKKIARLVWPT